MNILYITDTFIPDVSGGAVRAFHFCRQLSKAGHKITLITLHDGKNEWKQVKCFGKDLPQVFPGAGTMPFLAVKAFAEAAGQKFDVVFASMPSFGALISGYIVSRLYGLPLVAEARDPFIRTVQIEKGNNAYVFEKKFKGKALKILEGKIFKNARKIIVTNPAIIEEIRKVHALPEKKFEVIYNGVDLRECKNSKPKKFKKFTILYSGRITEKKCFDGIIEALKKIDAILAVCGAGNIKGLEKIAKEKGVGKKLRYLGKLSHQEALSYTFGADILYVPLDETPMTKYALPSKVFECMASGKPILAVSPKDGDLEKILKKHKCGINCRNNAKEIIKAIGLLRKNSKKIGRNGKKAVVKYYSGEMQARQLEKAFKEVIE